MDAENARIVAQQAHDDQVRNAQINLYRQIRALEEQQTALSMRRDDLNPNGSGSNLSERLSLDKQIEGLRKQIDSLRDQVNMIR